MLQASCLSWQGELNRKAVEIAKQEKKSGGTVVERITLTGQDQESGIGKVGGVITGV
jgi:hypothetical protein